MKVIYPCKTKGEGRDFTASKYTASLLKMAHMYQCQELVSACINHLKGNVTEANSVELFAVAKLVDSKVLKEVIFARMIVSSNPFEVIGTDEITDPQDSKELIGVWQKKYNQLQSSLTESNAKLVEANRQLKEAKRRQKDKRTYECFFD